MAEYGDEVGKDNQPTFDYFNRVIPTPTFNNQYDALSLNSGAIQISRNPSMNPMLSAPLSTKPRF
jgi:hypothetical protein